MIFTGFGGETMRKNVTFKVDNKGITIFINEDIDFQMIKEELGKRFGKNHRFFSNGLVRFNLGRRNLTAQEKEELLSFFQNKDRVLMVEFMEERGDDYAKPKTPSLSSQRICHIIEGTIRSGQQIEMEESLLINGDVNPGAEVVSKGNIYILGSLRGLAHAGSLGDETAYVYALVFKPTQLRIAAYIARSPDEEVKDNGPEIARVIGGKIVVEPFNIR